MKVHANPLPPTARDFARPGAAGGGRPATEAAAATTAAGAGETPATPATAKSADAQGPKGIPPGLEKVQARLQELAGERTRGQDRALGSISANIARYLEQHALATPVTPPPASEAPAGALPGGSDTATPPVVESPAETETPTAGAPSEAEAATAGIDTTA